MNRQRILRSLDHLVNGAAYLALGFSSGYGLTELESLGVQFQQQSDINAGIYAALGLVAALSIIQTGRKVRKAYNELRN